MKKIALIVDVKGWAFDLAAHIIKQALEDYFQIDIFYSKEEPWNENLITILENVKDYDIIHFFWRKTLLPICHPDFKVQLQEKGMDIHSIQQKISTGVYDHLFINDEEFYPIFNDVCKKYVTSSEKLNKLYTQNSKIRDPWGVLGDTFDEKQFYPKNLSRFEKRTDKPLVIGWVGNSDWNNKLKDKNNQPIDFKGFHTVLKPVIEELQKEGYPIETNYADKHTHFIPNEKMQDYYSMIDIYICVSITEGTPKPLLEAMGCGVPVITTNVGVACEVLGKKQQHFMLGEREIGKSDEKIRKQLKEKIKEIVSYREILKELSEENYEASKQFNSSVYRKKYQNYFLNF